MRTLIIALLLTGTVYADEPTPAWAKGQKVADWMSTGLVATSILLDGVHSFRSGNRKQAFECQAWRLGAAAGSAQVLKWATHRRRPDGSDMNSFPSQHTAIAATSSGWNISVGATFTIGTGYLRMAANKHHPSDVAVGMGLGILSAYVCR